MKHWEVVVLGIVGLLLLTVGIFTSLYPVKSAVFRKNRKLTVKVLVESKGFKFVTDCITGNKKGVLYKMSKSLLKKSETTMEIQTLYFYKLVSLIVTTVVLILVGQTNIEIMKNTIILKSSSHVNLFDTVKTEEYKYNFTLYKAAINRVGEKNMEKLDDRKKVDVVKEALAEQMEETNQSVLEERAKSIVRAFNGVKSIRLIDWKTLIMIFISFFVPECMLLLRRVLLVNKYRKEVIKLESVFELLGSIRGFKTVFILQEMSKASKTCSKQLKQCLNTFQSDKEKALEELKAAMNNKKFSRLVDIIRVYSMVDKELAIEILERNRIEKEEEMLLTAEEDIDIVDVIAFISVTPIIFELGNLLMKPMLDMIFQSFSVI